MSRPSTRSRTEFKSVLDEDADHFRGAMKRAGLDPELDSQKVGVESINFLSKAYEKAIDLRLAAAEYGLAVEAFARGLEEAGGEAGQLKRRLEQGVLPREILEADFKDLFVKVSDNEPIVITAVAAADVAKVGGKTKEETHDFDLSLTADNTEYKVDDHPSLPSSRRRTATSPSSASIQKGRVSVVAQPLPAGQFPGGGKELKFPGPDAPFSYRVRDPEDVTVVAVCNASGKDVDGIKHDFKKRDFTILATTATLLRAKSWWTVPRRSPKARRPKRRARRRHGRHHVPRGDQDSCEIAYKLGGEGLSILAAARLGPLLKLEAASRGESPAKTLYKPDQIAYVTRPLWHSCTRAAN